jgi:hypothetical protein
MRFRSLCALAIMVALAPLGACSSSSGSSAPKGTVASFDWADPISEQGYWDFPYPSDLNLTADGAPPAAIFPNPLEKDLIVGLRTAAAERKGYPVIPTAYFHFSAPLAARKDSDLIPASAASPILLVDVDDASPTRGALTPLVAATLPTDDYVPTGVLAVAVRPGFVLHPKRKYAFVVMKSLGDAAGAKLDAPADLPTLLAGQAPNATGAPQPSRGSQAAQLFGLLGKTLKDKLALDPAEVAVATVFTTGDVADDLSSLGTRVAAKYKITIDGLKVDPDDGASHDRYCELIGTVTYPQFQRGKPPFDTQGTFDMSEGTADAPMPKKQRDEVAPITITIPKGVMPASGWPLTVYFHGSGGVSQAVVDRGQWKPLSQSPNCPSYQTPDDWKGVKGCNEKGQGPAYVLAPHGIAMAGSALPVNPERLPGAIDYAYVNLSNLPALRDVFRQGVLEQRMFIEALRTLQIPPATIAACTGVSLPAGATAHKFDEAKLMAQGQSMGGMYTNMIAATEPRIRAAVPTGAGGFWTYFITHSHFGGVDSLAGLIAPIIGTDPNEFSYLHPALQLLETAWEPADPIVYVPRLAQNPLASHPTRHIYEPMGLDDSYFTPDVYDAMILAYGHKEAGDAVWATMQDALKLAGRDGILPYPLTDSATSEAGVKYTAAGIQYRGDGVYDPHAIYTQLDAVKYQYGCFLETYVTQGKPTIPAVAPLGTPCPH